MKIRSSFFSLCAMLLVAGALFTSCTQTNTPTTASKGTPVVSLAGTSFVDVTSLSDNQLYEFTVAGSSSATVINGFSSYANGTVRVFWTRGSGDTGMDTVYYRTTSSTTPSSGYQIWATADYTTSTTAAPLRIYETSDNTAGHNSGLILGSTAATARISGPDSSNIDLMLETFGTVAPFLSLESPDVYFSTGHKTLFADANFSVAGGLAMQHNPSDVSTTFTKANNTFDLFADPTLFGSSLVIVVKTKSNNYARVEVLPQSSNGGKLFGQTAPGTSGNKYYIDVNVTYQPSAGWGYVGRPSATTPGLAKRVSVNNNSIIHQ